jgi:type II restriction enzyme
MNLECRFASASSYKSRCQAARVVTEEWCAREVYCAACDSNHLASSRTNMPAIDFTCPQCEQPYQLKSLRRWNDRKVVDAGYDAMMRAIRMDRAPNLLILQYSDRWVVNNLLLIPSSFFSESVIEKRAPLSIQARRAGWVGCNILLGQIPADGKIWVVSNGSPIPKQEVRDEFSRIRGLSKIPPQLRGWTLDVLRAIRRLGKPRFTLQKLYEAESEMRALHPANNNVRPKMRQQLQVLRDLGLIRFVGPGEYLFVEKPA